MPRQKTKHTQIVSERVRKSTFKRRLDSLFKKAYELSILCGVEIVIIVRDPKEDHSTMWPSQDQVMNGVMKFLARSKEPGPKKMVLHEKFLNDKLKVINERLLKLQKKNEETEMGFLMNQLIEGGTFNELDLRQLNGLDQFVDEKLKKLMSRYDDLAGVQGQLSRTENSHHFQMTSGTTARTENSSGAIATTSIMTLMGDVTEDRWFSNTMPGIQNNLGISRGINIVPGSTEFERSFIEGNQGGVPDEFGRAWPTIFNP
ncbi:hypothetical protein C2S52_010998 [Perilla frutescens var. hirtella]|nr:hypothetical protein C2S52_010998 [Perilla frutescens var. hirtella]KAH6817802.1 hypothetical protein C2S51_001405 [Perilla frutescens var. frutescens]